MSGIGHRVFRNNTGLFVDSRGGRVRTGLCKGSSDLIGWLGCCARFLAIETKTENGRLTTEQANFLEVVNKSGGCGFVARSAIEAINKTKEHVCR